MAIRPILIDNASPFLGESCALCKQSLEPGDQLAVCPEDGTRHHVHCWQANGNCCTAFACSGQGVVRGKVILSSQSRINDSSEDRSLTLPERSFGCAQSCLLIAIAAAILLFAIGCFGLWAIADFVATQIFDWGYRAPLTIGTLPIAIPLSLLVVPAAFSPERTIS